MKPVRHSHRTDRGAHQCRPSRGSARGRRGIILVIVLVVVVIISLAGFSFVAFMFTENKGVHLRGEELQAESLAGSGQELLTAFLEQPAEARRAAGGAYDNPEMFRAVEVLPDEATGHNGRFSVVCPMVDELGERGVRFGVQDESSRLSLEAVLRWEQAQPGAGRRALMALPGMTTNIADCILDWLDADAEDRENGAEADFYAALDPPYAPRNGLPQSFEELLLVNGVTRELLFGLPEELANASDGRGGSRSAANRFAARGAGPHVPWASLLTLRSAERNVNERGEPRINVNGSDLPALHTDLTRALDEPLSRFVILYRQYGPAASAGTPAAAETVALDTSVPARFSIASLLDLVDARVAVPSPAGGEPTIVASPFTSEREAMRQDLPRLLDAATTTDAPVITGRVNVNEADAAVLAAVPGFDRVLVERIVTDRAGKTTLDSPRDRQPTWLLTEGLIDLAKMREILPYVTAGGDVHRAEIVGFFDDGGPTARFEVVIDAAVRPARPLYWKDLRPLGAGYTVEMIGAELEMRSTTQNGGSGAVRARSAANVARGANR